MVHEKARICRINNQNQNKNSQTASKTRSHIRRPRIHKKIIAEQTTWNEGTKSFAVVAYSSYLNKEGKIWNPPRYRRKEKIPFIPTEKELDQLISSSGKKLSIYLQCCKETGSDPGELLHMEWIDVNKENSTVTINYPVKGHNPE